MSSSVPAPTSLAARRALASNPTPKISHHLSCHPHELASRAHDNPILSSSKSRISDMAESSFPRAGTIAIISVSTIAAAALGYAAYFDHRRRNDPEFRRQLKRDSKRSARMAKEAEAASEKQQKQEILAALESAKNEVPTDPEEMEGFFMSKVAQGEQMISSGETQT